MQKIYRTVLLFGLISLFGDIIYEGSRGLIPSYLYLLGASAVVIGTIAGIGDLIGYALRSFFGYLSDKKRNYWAFIFIGYFLIISIPFIGLFSSWIIVILLVIVERIGKAVRGPARDTLLSLISNKKNIGKVFGIHEFFDQVGAVIGPLVVGLMMFYTASYKQTFLSLFIPFVLMIIAVFLAYKKFPPRLVQKKPSKVLKKLSKDFYIYSAGVFFNTLAILPWSLILLKSSKFLSSNIWLVPIIYMLIQLIDAPSSLVSGFLYDRFGTKLLFIPFTLAFLPTFLAFQNSLGLVVLSALLYGLILGMKESIYRAAVSVFSPKNTRGFAYGMFNTLHGIGFLISGFVYGFFIDVGAAINTIIFFSLSSELLSIILLLKIRG